MVLSLVSFHSAFGPGPISEPIRAYSLFALAGLVLAGRRRFPLSTMVVSSALFMLIGIRYEELAPVFTLQMTLFAAIYGAWAWSRRPRALYVATGAVLLAMFAWLGWAFVQPDATAPGPSPSLLPRDVALIGYVVALNLVYFFGAIAWGQAAWRSARRSEQIDATFVLERDLAENERLRAVQSERVRIARELHDVVAHHVSTIGIHAAGAQRVLGRNPEQAAAALATIEDSARRGVTQMHQLVSVLRDDDTGLDRHPMPTLAAIAGLADPEGRPRVQVTIVGESVAIDDTTDLNLFRIAQEAVTNARRHAGARTINVTVRHHDDAVEIEVIDDGRGAPDTPHAGSGFGLTGVRERAEVLGAEIEIGNRPTGGFRVRVRAPRSRTPEGAAS